MPKNSIQNRFDAKNLQPVEPTYSEQVENWMKHKKNALYIDDFNKVVNMLNSNENRIRQPSPRKYDYRSKLFHKHVEGKIAIFYRYIDTVLHVMLVGKRRKNIDIRCCIIRSELLTFDQIR